MSVVFISRLMAVTAGLMMLVGASSASTLTPDFSPAGHEAALRDGDFDGDGRLDRLQLVAEDSGRIAVHVRLNTAAGERDIRMTSVEARPNVPMDLQVAAPGAFAGACGDYSDGCQARIETAQDSLVIGLDDGVNLLIHWQNDHFEPDFVRSSDAMMAQSLAQTLAISMAGVPTRNP